MREWLRALPRDGRKAVGKDIAKVEFGWPIGMPYCRALGDGLWEIRSGISDGRIARVLFFLKRGEMMLVHAFIKKTQKTPDDALRLAQKRMKEFSDD